MKRRNKVDEAGANMRRESVLIADLMVEDVETLAPDDTVGKARTRMLERGIHGLPIVDRAGTPVGIVTATDLLEDVADDTRIDAVMTDRVYTVPTYSRISDAARLMLNHRIHHLIVTNEQRIVGILSSFDLLRLVADKRFVMKDAASRPRHGGHRRREEGLEG